MTHTFVFNRPTNAPKCTVATPLALADRYANHREPPPDFLEAPYTKSANGMGALPCHVFKRRTHVSTMRARHGPPSLLYMSWHPPCRSGTFSYAWLTLGRVRNQVSRATTPDKFQVPDAMAADASPPTPHQVTQIPPRAEIRSTYTNAHRTNPHGRPQPGLTAANGLVPSLNLRA